MHESSAYELILEEGGIREAQQILLLQGNERLGRADDGVVSALKKIQDLDRLNRLAAAVLHASTWQELLATP
jgi:hypothetical protein